MRAVTDPWPGAFATLAGRKVLVWAAETRRVTADAAPGTVLADPDGALLVATGEGVLELLDVSWEDGAHEAGAVWARGAAASPGVRFAPSATSDERPVHGKQGVTK